MNLTNNKCKILNTEENEVAYMQYNINPIGLLLLKKFILKIKKKI